MRQKIIFCIPTLGHGGAENIILRLCNGLVGEFDIDLFLIQRCTEDAERIAQLDRRIRLICLYASILPTISFGFRLRRIFSYTFFPILSVWLFFKLKIRSYHVVHVNLTQFALFSIIWGWLFRYFNWTGGLVQTFHTNQHLLKKISRKIFRISWRFCDRLIVEIDESELVKVHSYINPERTIFIPFAVPETLHQDTHNFTGAIQWGSLARLRLFEKRFDKILLALKILKEKGVAFNYHIGGDGPDRQVIESMVDSLGLNDNVVFHGFVSEPTFFYKQLDGLIVATVGNDCGIAGLQALASGIPLIGFDTLGKGNSDDPAAVFRVAGTATDLSGLLMEFNDCEYLRNYFIKLRAHKKDYIGDQVMIQRYRNLFKEVGRPKVDLAFMADYGRRSGKGLEVRAIYEALVEAGVAGVCTVRSAKGVTSSWIRNAHWTGNYMHRAFSACQKFIWKNLPARYMQELIFDGVCARYYSKRIVPAGQILYLVPRMPKTIRAAKAAGYHVVLHIAEMAPDFNIQVLTMLYGDAENWPSIWSISGLLKATDAVREVDEAIAHTCEAKRSYVQMGLSTSSIYVTPMGYEPRSLPEIQMDSRSFFDGKTRFLYLGNVTKMKGSHILLESWQLVSDEKCELHICGEVYEDMLSEVAEAKKRFKNIYFHGYVDPLPYFHLCTVFVFPSLSESFGRAMLEAAAAGLPILCNKNVALDDYYEIKKFGIYFEPNSYSLTNAMNSIKNKISLQIEMGNSAATHFKNFTWERFGKETAGILQTISNHRLG